MGSITENYHCSDCKADLSNVPALDDGLTVCCPDCGSEARTLKVTVSEQIRFYDCVRGKVKNLERRGKRKIRQEFISGADFCVRNGEMVRKWRLIGRDNNLYIERVSRIDTDEVVHFVKEKLSDHVNNGSAKDMGGK
jgi:DNA-directed RNA polymerase subunit RPC12/RpoP